MKRWSKVLALVLAVVMAAGAFAGCGKKADTAQPAGMDKPGKPSQHAASETPGAVKEEKAKEIFAVPDLLEEEYPVVDGSTATLPLGRLMYALSTGVDEETAEMRTEFTKTTNSYLRLMDGEADLIISYEAGVAAKEREGYADLEIKPIGLDALVFLCNEKNPLESLTSKEIQDIYTGKVTNWSELGGENKEILAFQRPINSGSQTLMQNLMMQGKIMSEAPAELRPGEMGDLMEEVAYYNNEANALGYSVYYYANTMYVLPGVRFMAVDEVLPSNETIRSGAYGYVNPFYAAVRKDEPEGSPARQLFDWLTSASGQAIIDGLGYVSVDEPNVDLPEGIFEPTVEGNANGKVLVVDATVYNGSDGVVVFDEKLRPLKQYYEVAISRSAVIQEDYIVIGCKPRMLNSDERAEYNEMGYYEMETFEGAYDVLHDKWIVEPEYHSVIRNEIGGREVLAAVRHYDNWDRNEVTFYDLTGKVLEKKDYDYDSFYELDLFGWNDESLEYDYEEGVSTYYLGKGAKYTRKSNKCQLYLNGELVAESENGYVMPFDGENRTIFDGCYYVHMYNMDEDYNVTEIVADKLLDSAGNEIANLKTGRDTYLFVACASFYVTTNSQGVHVIRNLDGGKVYSWVHTNYDNDDGYEEVVYDVGAVENNGRRFVGIGGKVYFRAPGQRSLDESTEGGTFSYVEYPYDDRLVCYDPKTRKAKDLFRCSQYGNIYVSGGKIYGHTGNPGNEYVTSYHIGGQSLYGLGNGFITNIDETGKYMVKWVQTDQHPDVKLVIYNNGVEYASIEDEEVFTSIAVIDGQLYYTAGPEGERSLYRYDIKGGESHRIAGLEESGNLVFYQMEVKDGKYYMSAAYSDAEYDEGMFEYFYITGDDNGHLVYDVQHEADVLPFVVKNGKMVACDGIPGHAYVEDFYGEGVLVYYDENGMPVTVATGYGVQYDENTYIYTDVEVCEKIGDKLYLIQNDLVEDTDKEGGNYFRRVLVHYLAVDTRTGKCDEIYRVTPADFY